MKTKLDKIVMYISAYLVLSSSIYFGINNMYPVMSITFLSFTLFILIANLDRISEFKATTKGIEAKTREVLDEARFTIRELQNMVRILAKTELSLVIRAGRFGGYNFKEKQKTEEEVLNLLKSINITNREIPIILSEWYKFFIHDYVMYILGGATLPKNITADGSNEWKALRKRAMTNPPIPEELLSFLNKYNCKTERVEELVEDYSYYLENKKHRRIEIWIDCQSWGPLECVKQTG